MKRNVKIVSTGMYLPNKRVTSIEIDKIIDKPDGWTEKKSGVKERRFVQHENQLDMAVYAIKDALLQSDLSKEHIDCIVSTSAIMAQPIPCTAALIQRELGLGNSGIASFDINSTCLGFVIGMDIISYLIDAGRYKKVLIISSEIASHGLNWNDHESCILFGDGAVAMIMEKTPDGESSGILSSHLETYGNGAKYSEIRSGGGLCVPHNYTKEIHDDFLFSMKGEQIYKMSARLIPRIIDKILNSAQIDNINDLKLLIPHQASAMAMRLIAKRIGIESSKFYYFIENYGNMISASIPLGIHLAIKEKKIKRGDAFGIIGTSAGLSIGGMVLEY